MLKIATPVHTHTDTRPPRKKDAKAHLLASLVRFAFAETTSLFFKPLCQEEQALIPL